MDDCTPNYLDVTFTGDQITASREEIKETFERGVTNLDIEWVGERPFFTLKAAQLPGVMVSEGLITPNRTRTADSSVGSDEYLLTWVLNKTRARCTQRGRTIEPDELLFVTCEDSLVGEAADAFGHMNIRLSRAALHALLPNADAKVGNAGVPRDDGVLRLITGYIRSLDLPLLARRTDLSHLAATYITDLVAIMLGATGDGRHVAMGRGGKAALLGQVERWITAHSGVHSLTIADAARAHAMSTRTLQTLFAEAGTTFTDFLLERRLQAARHSVVTTDAPVAVIAFAAGFGDVSHFNHRYRSRFGETPSDTRRRSLTLH